MDIASTIIKGAASQFGREFGRAGANGILKGKNAIYIQGVGDLQGRIKLPIFFSGGGLYLGSGGSGFYLGSGTALFQMADQIFIVTGIGKKKNFHRGLLEQAAAAAIRTGCAAGLDSFALDAASPLESVSDSDYQLLAGRGACWGSYRFSAFKSDAEISEPPSLTFFGEQADASILRFAQIQGDALRKTADLANLPGNRATPEKIAHYAKELAQEFGLKYEVFGASDLAEKGCEAFLAVAQGSGQDPEMVLLRKEGTDPDLPPLVLIGKTVTFDAGGISLKPGRNMGWMRYDKCGAHRV